MITNKVELLAPAGSYESLKGAVHAGADAVYMGGALFSARAYADNPDNEGLKKSVEYCHFYGKKLYLAVNTLLKQNELDNLLYDYISYAYNVGIDGVIVQDPGVMRSIYRHFQDLPIHVSTQASVMTAEGAEYLRSLIPSITRVVPARELSIKELKAFRADTSLEMEVFVHGALCVCYSGMCLMSSYIGDRSGNRGRCAQPCRKLYEYNGNSSYLLSPKDQCLLDSIPDLIEAGVDSFKIEGRMKSPEYTAGTVAVYRKRIDEVSKGSEVYLAGPMSGPDNGKKVLAELYNRGGFNSGYLYSHNGDDMMSMKRPNHSGLYVGNVVSVNGREAVIRLSDEIYAHDVLEIRRHAADGGQPEDSIFEFTTAEAASKGSEIRILTMKDRRAKAGDEVYRTKCEDLLNRIKNTYLDNDPKLPAEISFNAHLGMQAELNLKVADGNVGYNSVTVKGDTVSAAQKAPATVESMEKQLTKLGDTRFSAGNTVIDIDDNIFIPVSQLNSMRRDAAEKLEEAVIQKNSPERTGVATLIETAHCTGGQAEINRNSPNMIESTPQCTKKRTDKKLFVSCWNTAQACAAADAGIDEICFNISDLNIKPVDDTMNRLGNRVKLIVGLPYACRYEFLSELKGFIGNVIAKYPEICFMARNYDEIGIFEKYYPEVMKRSGLETDYMPYYTNRSSVIPGVRRVTLSQELDEKEITGLADQLPGTGGENIEKSLIIYGYQPSMISAQCVYKNATGKCRKGRNARTEGDGTDGFKEPVIISSGGNEFKTKQLCGFCTNIIYNSACLNNIDRIGVLSESGIDCYRIDFTFESPEEVRNVIETVEKKNPDLTGKFTRGHLYRPVL